jgi:hypothetical protein
MSVRYRVAYMERKGLNGRPADHPPDYVTSNLAEGVVLDTEYVEGAEPQSHHASDELDEDDNILSYGTEVWEYDVADNRTQEFEDALAVSPMVMEHEVLDDVSSNQIKTT